MNKKQKEVIQSQLDKEKAVLKKLEKQYQAALNDIINKAKILQVDIDMLQAAGVSDDTTLSMVRSKVYQKQYQQALQQQITGILDKLHSDEYSTIQGFLNGCYEDGYIGTMYDLQGQGIPIIAPIDHSAAVKAVQLDSKVVEGYYNHLGVDFDNLKKVIPQEVSRGIASARPYTEIARNLNNASKSGLYNAQRIARTEGHRIQQQSAEDAREAAKKKGADVLKQWDASLDGRTRDSHRRVDGEIRETDEKFSNGLRYAGDPNGGAAEVINCRCVTLTRARWALDEEELETLKDRAAYFGLNKTDNFDDYTKKYLKASEIQAEVEQTPKPKKEYLTEKKLKQKIDEADKELADMLAPFGGDEAKFAAGASAEDQVKYLALVDNKNDWQKNLDKKLLTKEKKKLAKEQVQIQEQLDTFQIKTYSGIWKDDVTTADWGAKQGSIAAKKKYFEGKFIHAVDADEMKKWQGLLDDLKDFDTNGKAYYDLQKQLAAKKAAILNLKAGKTTAATPFTADAYGQRKDDAWVNRFTDRYTADKHYRPLLDSNWNNLTDEQKFGVWQYTHNSHPINRPLSGYDRQWGNRQTNFKGFGGVSWDNENNSNYDGVLHSSDFINKFANATNSSYGGRIRQYSDVIGDLTNAIEKNSLADDVWLVRGSDNDGFAGLLDSSIISFNDAKSLLQSGDIATLKSIVTGQAFQMHSFTSTGIADGTGFGGSISYKIYAPKGTKAIYAEPQSYYGHTISGEELYTAGKHYSGVGSEAEIIVQRGTSYRITDIKQKGSGYEVMMEVVEQPNYFKSGYEHTFDDGLTVEK